MYLHISVDILAGRLNSATMAGSAQRWPASPLAVGISGVSKAGKTTLAAGLWEHLCGQSATRMTRRWKKDKVDRYEGLSGTRVSLISQDSYHLSYAKATTDVVEEAFWDRPESLNHDAIFAVLKAEKEDPDVDYIIFEGFKAFHDDRVLPLLDVLLWIDLPKELARRRSKKSETHFESHVWKNHECYMQRLFERGVWEAGNQWKRIPGEQPEGSVLDIAVRFLSQRCKTLLSWKAKVPPWRKDKGRKPVLSAADPVAKALASGSAGGAAREDKGRKQEAKASPEESDEEDWGSWKAPKGATLQQILLQSLASPEESDDEDWGPWKAPKGATPDAVPVLSAADPVANALASGSAGGAARDEPPGWLKRCPEVLRGSIVKSRRRGGDAACDARTCFADAVEVIPVTSFKDEDLWWK